MKLLITGSNGQVGTELKAQGTEAGYEVLATDRSLLDITDERAVLDYVQTTRPTIVINAAAYTAVDKAEDEAALADRVNRDAAGYLAVACQAMDIPLLHISTDFVFDGTKVGAYVETDTCNPVSSYGRSKLAGEQQIQKSLKKHIILRTAWVFGGESNFVNTMRRLGAEREELTVVSDQIGGPTAASDIAKCLLKISESVSQPSFNDWGIYHYTGTPSVSWYEFAVEILKDNPSVKVKPIPTSGYPTPAMRPANSVLDCTKIAEIFNIIQPDWRDKL